MCLSLCVWVCSSIISKSSWPVLRQTSSTWNAKMFISYKGLFLITSQNCMFYQSIDNLWTKKISHCWMHTSIGPLKGELKRFWSFLFRCMSLWYIHHRYYFPLLVLKRWNAMSLIKNGEGQVCVLLNTPNSSSL